MPENVPPKETAKADALNPDEQAPGQPRGEAGPPAAPAPPATSTAPPAGDALFRNSATGAGDLGPPPDRRPRRSVAAAAAPAAADIGPSPGPDFVKIRWKNKIGGDEADMEWAERRRAENLQGTGHAEIVKEDEGK